MLRCGRSRALPSVALVALVLGACTHSEPAARDAGAAPNGPSAASLGPIDLASTRDKPQEDEPAGTERGWFGVELVAVSPPSAGVGIRGVVPGSPAARAGFSPGDVIVSIDGQSVGAPGDVVRLIGEKGAGRRASIVFARGSTQRLVAVDLERVPSDDEILRQSYVGSPAPAFESLKTVQGALDPSLGALRGKVVVVEFWAPWCFVCRMLVPVMNDWHSRYSAQGVVVMGITSESVEPTAQSAYQLGMTYPIAADETGRTSRAYRAVAVPTLFVVDRKGTVRDVLVGYSGRRLHEIDGLIANLVAER